MVNSGVELAGQSKEMARRASDSFRGIARLFEEVLGGIPGVENPAAVARVLESVFLGLRVLRRTGDPPARIQRIARETVEFLLPVESLVRERHQLE